MKLLHAIILATALTLTGGVGQAQPHRGTLIGSDDGDILTYSCSAVSNGRISCDFIQVLLRNKASDDDLEALISQSVVSLENPDDGLEDLCSLISQLHEMFLGGMSRSVVEQIDTIVDVDEFLAEVSKREGFYRSFTTLGRDLCSSRTEEAMQSFVEFNHRVEAQTCTPMVFEYSQTFVIISDKLYVVETSPEGTCGVIDTSRFSNQSEGQSTYSWDYISSKIVTNRPADNVICNILSEEPVHYNSSTTMTQIDCTYIEYP